MRNSVNHYYPAMLVLICLILLLTANGVPILVQLLPGMRRRSRPVDCGYRLADGQRLFGEHKTWQGIIAAIPVTALVAWPLGLSPWTGGLIALFSMSGDLLGSFVKRRLKLAPGARSIGLDQLPESLLPLLFLRQTLGIDWTEVLLVVLLFIAVDLLLSRVLYQLRIRRNPW